MPAPRRSRELGAEIVTGDLLDFASVSSALAGVTAAYFCYPIVPGLLDATAIFAQAATEAGVTAVVNMSQISARRDAKSHAAQNHWLAERLLDRSAFATAHLRPTFFAEWLAWQWSRDDDGGVFRLPFADGRHAPIAAVDQARVIAAILGNPMPHDRQIYPLYGPTELDYDGIAAKVAAVLGFPVRYEPVDIDTFGDVLRVEGHGDYFVQHITSRGAGLPRRHLRRNQQPRRGDLRNSSDDRGTVRRSQPRRFHDRRSGAGVGEGACVAR